MILALAISLLPLMASAAPAPAPIIQAIPVFPPVLAPVPAPDVKRPTSSSNFGSLPDGWQSASGSLVLDNVNNQRILTGGRQGGATFAGSPGKCAQFCQDQGWPLAGVEYGGECFCASKLSNGGSLTQLSFQGSMPCSSDNSLNCGGPNGLNLFYDSRVVSKGSSNFDAKVDLTKQTNGFAATNLCLKETGDGAARLFKGASFTNDKMTSAMCTSFCDGKGFTQAGLEYGRECYCSNDVALSNAATAGNCDMSCPGGRTETCGGSDALTVYQKAPPPPPPAPKPVTICTPSCPPPKAGGAPGTFISSNGDFFKCQYGGSFTCEYKEKDWSALQLWNGPGECSKLALEPTCTTTTKA